MLLLGCGVDPLPADSGTGVDASACGSRPDPDGDGIPSDVEGSGDADGDGLPNGEDPDADGDGVPDAEERGGLACIDPPVDRDGDGAPDFLDTDANGDGHLDASQSGDTDGDGELDRLDLDVDGDSIPNSLERGPEGVPPLDSDGDGTPDVFDLDSDGDFVSDREEGAADRDGDGEPNFRDLDSDGDERPDADEAGDQDLATPARHCPVEVDPLSFEPGSDATPDFLDNDSDNDGLGDREEAQAGTDVCGLDSDADGVGDLAEVAYARVNCPDGVSGLDCGCATDPECAIPPQHFYVVLPRGAPPQERDLDFSTDIRVADVFFLTDLTGSMGAVLGRVQDTVSTPGSGLIARIGETIPEAWFGGGAFQDFPLTKPAGFGEYGTTADRAFSLAVPMSPPEDALAVAAAFDALTAAGGGDAPEAHTEALFQTITGEGGTWVGGGRSYAIRGLAGDCVAEGAWGAPCFRDPALAIIVLFSDVCAHSGPPGESALCDAYAGISPAPAAWSSMTEAMNRRGARFVGINSNASSQCAGGGAAAGTSPCFFLRATAIETGSVDLDGEPLVYDLPEGGASTGAFVDTVVSAVETVATRVPLHLDTQVRDDGGDVRGVDASRFVLRRQPACAATPAPERCWTAPPELAHDEAVAAFDQSTFFGVVPGAVVTFRITFGNTFLDGGRASEIYVAFIDVRAGTAVLDTRQVFVVIPANPEGPLA